MTVASYPKHRSGGVVPHIYSGARGVLKKLFTSASTIMIWIEMECSLVTKTTLSLKHIVNEHQ